MLDKPFSLFIALAVAGCGGAHSPFQDDRRGPSEFPWTPVSFSAVNSSCIQTPEMGSTIYFRDVKVVFISKGTFTVEGDLYSDNQCISKVGTEIITYKNRGQDRSQSYKPSKPIDLEVVGHSITLHDDGILIALNAKSSPLFCYKQVWVKDVQTDVLGIRCGSGGLLKINQMIYTIISTPDEPFLQLGQKDIHNDGSEETKRHRLLNQTIYGLDL